MHHSTASPRIRSLFPAIILAGVVAGLLLFHSPIRAGEAEPLSEALQKGKVKFEAIAMHGFEKIDISVYNLTGKPLRINPAGAVLMPPDPALQRLGLGAPVDADPGDPESLFIHIPPKGRWSGTIWSVCLDHGKGVPASGVPYTLSARTAEGKALEILRYWARNPWIQQKTVNDLIWTGQDLKVLRSQVIPAWLRKSTLAAWGGEVFWLSGTGHLFRLAGEEWKWMGKGFEKVHVAQGWIVGTHRAINGIRFRSLTGDGWKFKSLAGIPLDILPAPDFVLFARVEDSLMRLETGKEDFVKAAPFDVADATWSMKGKEIFLSVIEKDTGKVQILDPRDGKWKALPGTAAKRIASSRGSLYAEFETGVFRYGKDWVKVAETGTHFLPGRASCFLFRGWTIRCFDEKTGKSKKIPSLNSTTLCVCVDPAEDVLYAMDERGKIWSWAGENWKALIKAPRKSD